jgi:hypothetical protein
MPHLSPAEEYGQEFVRCGAWLMITAMCATQGQGQGQRQERHSSAAPGRRCWPHTGAQAGELGGSAFSFVIRLAKNVSGGAQDGSGESVMAARARQTGGQNPAHHTDSINGADPSGTDSSSLRRRSSYKSTPVATTTSMSLRAEWLDVCGCGYTRIIPAENELLLVESKMGSKL